jgi:PPOX class probable F420-dependent enzyme
MTAELSPDLEAFLSEPRNAILCINRGEGRAPHATPVWFHYSGGRIYISITRTRVKYRLLQQAPEVSLVIDDSQTYRTVLIEGTARLEDDDAMLVSVVRALRTKYGHSAPSSDATLLRDLQSEERVIVSLPVERLLSWMG